MIRLEEPSIIYKEQLIEIIDEYIMADSHMNGSSHLMDYRDDIEGWLKHLEEAKNPSGDLVPAITYILIDDDKIIGLQNIRLKLNEQLMKAGGHIGYSIRPSMRRRGYNKINLYLGLKECSQNNMDVVLLDCIKNNLGSSKSMIALGGILIREWYDEKYQDICQRYQIDVNDSLSKYRDIYEPMIKMKKK